MYIFRYLIVVFHFLSFPVLSQIDSIHIVLDEYDKVQELSDLNERNYKLFNLSSEWMGLINSKFFTYPINETHSLKEIKSADGKFTVYYFIHPDRDNLPKVELFITSSDSIFKKPYHFSETLPIKRNVKKDQDVSKFKMNIFINRIQNIDLYELQLTENNNPIILYKYSDIYLKLLFENMALNNDLNEKLKLNDAITNRLRSLLSVKEDFNNRFESINRMSTLISEDDKLKICTWNIEKEDATHNFYGLIVLNHTKSDLEIFPLIDVTEKLRSPERSSLTPQKWYGAIYYDIIETSYKKNTYYTLLGFKGNDEFTKIKVLDALTILSNGNIRFGTNIFNKNPGYTNRIIYEYSSNANMMLRYDKNLKMIVMDNLAPSSNLYRNVYRFYGPDFSYNGYKFEKGKWMLYLDLDLRNPKEQ